MKPILSLAVLCLFTPTVWGQQTLGDYHWPDLAQKGLLHGGVPTTFDGREVLKIENTNDAPLQVNLLTVEDPNITKEIYELTGELKYEAVQGDGFLELWNYFPPLKPGLPEGQYFSRTLGDAGPMGKISGTSGWREFVLPFNRAGASNQPVRLQMNLILPGRGTVYIGPVKLVQIPNVKSVTSALYPNAWWSAPVTGVLFGWGGAFIACLAAICGLLGYRGKARGFVIAVLGGLSILGVLEVIAGILGLAQNQPVFIWLPLMGCGILLVAICPYHSRLYQRNYEALELRRMASLDASGA